MTVPHGALVLPCLPCDLEPMVPFRTTPDAMGQHPTRTPGPGTSVIAAAQTPTPIRRHPTWPAWLSGRRRLGRRGATAAEFALMAIPTTLLMYGVMEASWQVATLAALDHATLRAVRFGTTGLGTPPNRAGSPTCRSAAIPWLASQVTAGFLNPARLTVTTNNFSNYTSSAARTGGTTGAGIGGRIVTYDLTYTQPWLLGGLIQLVTGANTMTYRSSLTIKNEPFDDTVC